MKFFLYRSPGKTWLCSVISSENTIKVDPYGQQRDSLILAIVACLHLFLFHSHVFCFVFCFNIFYLKGFNSVLILLRLILFFKEALVLFLIVCCVLNREK